MDNGTDARGRFVRFSLGAIALVALVGVARVARSAPHPPAAGPQAHQAVDIRSAGSDLPLRFEANMGHLDTQVSYLAHGPGYLLFLTPTESVVGLPGDAPRSFRMAFKGGNPSPTIFGENPLPGYSRYLFDSKPTQWHRDIPTYAKVRFHNVYPGIDVVYNGAKGQLAYDLVMDPGADLSVIALDVEGADSVTLEIGGDLLVHTPSGVIRYGQPTVYEKSRDGIRELRGAYVLKSEREVGLQLASTIAAPPQISETQLGLATGNAGMVYAKPSPPPAPIAP
jgi:hypothetical protein